jgi:hypothetical protein
MDVKRNLLEDFNKEKNCMICNKETKETNVTITCCNHLFHCSCLIKNILFYNNECPICCTNLEMDREEMDIEEEEEEDKDNFRNQGRNIHIVKKIYKENNNS